MTKTNNPQGLKSMERNTDKQRCAACVTSMWIARHHRAMATMVPSLIATHSECHALPAMSRSLSGPLRQAVQSTPPSAMPGSEVKYSSRKSRYSCSIPSGLMSQRPLLE